MKTQGNKLTHILFVHNCLTSFVHMDLDNLRGEYPVTELSMNSRLLNPLHLWRQMKDHTIIFGWFASWHTFLPMLFARLQRKPSLLVIGGYDLANIPEIGYGHQRGGLKKWVSRCTIHLASRLITNSYYSRTEAEKNAGIAKKNVHVIYHGVPDPFGSLPQKDKERMVLTVGNVDRTNLWRKGHEPFVRAAGLLPDVKFVLVGAWQDATIQYLRSIASPNVTFTGRIAQSTLNDIYQRASVYVQPSLHEGFGMSVAEAMLAGCIPVVTRRGSLPEVVGDCGLFIESHDPETLAEAIREALEYPDFPRQRARDRILTHFPMEKRAQALSNLITDLVSG